MSRSSVCCCLVALCALPLLAQDEVAIDKALFDRIQKLNEQPREVQEHQLRELAVAVSKRPDRNLVALADNLVVSLDEVRPVSRETLQLVATTLADALRKAPKGVEPDSWTKLAELARYEGATVTLEDPKYKAAIAQLEDDEAQRRKVTFKLRDVGGEEWDLQKLRGKVVLVNFWATWCPPCRAELPQLAALMKEFGSKGLVILSVTPEEASAVKPALAELKFTNPVLLDPDSKVQAAYRSGGFPAAFLYGRDGEMVLPYELPDIDAVVARVRAQFARK